MEGSGRQGEGKKKQEDKKKEKKNKSGKEDRGKRSSKQHLKDRMVVREPQTPRGRPGGGEEESREGRAASRAHHVGADSPKERETTGGGFRVQGALPVQRGLSTDLLIHALPPCGSLEPCVCLGSVPGRMKGEKSRLCLNSDFHVTRSKELQLNR